MIYLRNATSSDLPLMMAWRSQERVYQGFYSQKLPLIWEEHLNWWKSRNKDWHTFIIVLLENNQPRDIGVVTIGQLDHWSPEVGYYIGETTLWGKGFGTEAVRQVLLWLKEKGYKFCHTTIKIENTRSIKLAWSLGFQMVGGAREDEVYLQRPLEVEYGLRE